MLPQTLRQSRSHPRAGFTLVEMMLAATVSALTATAAATMVFAIANASQETRDRRGTIAAGHYLVNRIGETIREARSVGQVTSTTISLWVEDTNANDQMDLSETATIRYDSTNKQVICDRVVSASADTTLVTYSTFTTYSTLSTQMNTPDRKSVVWGEGIESFAASGYPSLTNTRVVDVNFKIGIGQDETGFNVSASPKGSGDYLYLVATRGNMVLGRVTRKYYSLWDGYASHPDSLSISYKTPTSGGGVAAP
jgi:prepilin-type N-terminal cleavage/methylation domain-containing protein